MGNRVFFPQLLLDQWSIEGKIDLSGSDLVLHAEGRRYVVEECVRVVAEVSGSSDTHGLVGKVWPKADLEGLSAEILEGSMVLGDNAYDVVPGWCGRPTTTLREHLASPERTTALRGAAEPSGPPASEEQLLARLLEATR